MAYIANQPTHAQSGAGYVKIAVRQKKNKPELEWIELSKGNNKKRTMLHMLPTGIIEHESIDEDNKAGMGAVIAVYDIEGNPRG